MIASVTRLENENALLKKKLSSLTSSLDNAERFSRQKNIEIQNVPKKTGENLMDVVSRIGASLQSPVDPLSIDYVTRVPTQVKNMPKNIIVPFVSKITRFSSCIPEKRLSEKSSQAGLSVIDVADKLYINEHLTLTNKRIFKEARAIARSKGFKFVWTQNGNVLIRKSETSRILQISSEDDLKRL